MLFTTFVFFLSLSQTLAFSESPQGLSSTPRPEARRVGRIADIAAAEASAAHARKTSSVASAMFAQRSAWVVQQDAMGISVGTSNDTLPDPCGPSLQAQGEANSTSTCHASVNTTDVHAQQYYGIECWKDATGAVIDEDFCETSILTICSQISGLSGTAYQSTNEWIWSTNDGNCTFGYWLPEGGAPPPSYLRCMDQIYGPMVESCAETLPYNGGSVNLKQLPKASVNEIVTNGTAVDPMYPSYIMVAQRGYEGINRQESS
ncbi:hypothetical protein ACLMJK_008126 [Lecanora helva]